MGIYDRHYIRDTQAPTGGLRAVHMWSVTTWLIVICVGVYVIDGLLPPRFVPTGQLSPEVQHVPPEMWRYGSAVRETQLPVGQSILQQFEIELIERSSGRRIGWAEARPMRFLQSFLHFSTYRAIWPHIEWWRLIGFQFLHGNFAHLLFNMVALYFFGPMVEQYLGSKRYLAFYLLCGIFGALMYLALNLGGYAATQFSNQPVAIPGLLFNDPSTPLVGASAGIFGILMAGAYMAPNAVVYFFFILPLRLRTLAYLLVGLALFTVLRGGQNAGGEAGHLGGALAGAYFIRRPHHLHGFFDFLGRADPTSHHYRNRAGTRQDRKERSSPSSSSSTARQHEIDRILDKIQQDGIHSLTESEKRSLRDASER